MSVRRPPRPAVRGINRARLLGGLTAAMLVSAAIASAAAAEAATISVAQACVVNPLGSEGPVTVNGAGFTPGDTISLSSTTGDAFGTATAAADGTFTTTFAGPDLSSLDPISQTFTMTAMDDDDGTTAQTTFVAANFALKVKPAEAKPDKKVTYTFSGFRAGAEIYGHYIHRKKVVLTNRFGLAQGACGQLTTHARLYPGDQRYSSYTVQFDDSKKYSPHSTPRLVTSVTLIRF